MLIIEPIGGLANRMRVIASALSLQKELTCDIMCVWNQNYDLNAPFESLFEKIPGLMIKTKPFKYKYLKSSFQAGKLKCLIARNSNKFLGIDFCLKQKDFNKGKVQVDEISQKIKNGLVVYIQTYEEFGDNLNEFQKFVPVVNLSEEIESIYGKFSETIGVHIRRTDNELAITHSPTTLFVEKIKNEITQNKKTTFFLCTDDVDVEKDLIQSFGDKIITRKKVLSRNSVRGIQDAVIDMFCLSKTKRIYGSYWSSFSIIASRIGKIEFTALKKDEI